MAVDEPGAEFKLVGGRLCLDFVNTVSGRLPNPGSGGVDYRDLVEKERLVTWADLARWAAATGVASRGALEKAGRADPAAAGRMVPRARALREALYRVFTSALDRRAPPEADLAVLNRELQRARDHERLAFANGRISLAFEADQASPEQILWAVVRSATDLLTSEELVRVTRCPGDACAWLFLDTTRNRSRRWCDMADCGNRAKVRRFRGGS